MIATSVYAGVGWIFMMFIVLSHFDESSETIQNSRFFQETISAPKICNIKANRDLACD